MTTLTVTSARTGRGAHPRVVRPIASMNHPDSASTSGPSAGGQVLALEIRHILGRKRKDDQRKERCAARDMLFRGADYLLLRCGTQSVFP